ncbi:AAA family ATPase [Massilia sp. SR12]
MKTKIQALLNQLNDGLVERESAVRLALLAVLAGENVILVGPPGTGKSLIARRIASCLDAGDGGHFEYLLTKFSTPEEIFGPLSITELKADRFRRNTAGYLPSVKLAFLDEVFKASSSILNSLLTILNERRYHNGTEVMDVPLRALIGASNELPVGQEELNALYDRFLLRGFVDYVSEEGLLRLFAPHAEHSVLSRLSDDDLATISARARKVAIPQEIAGLVQGIWIGHKAAFKEDNRESLSDRRLRKVVHLMKVSAATNGRDEVDYSDVLLLKDCLWNHPDNRDKVTALVIQKLRGISAFSNAAGAVVGISAKTPAPPSGSVKGLAGEGTRNSPFHIASFEDLERLTEVEVGQGGFYFRQTADIDASNIAVWLKINFKGHFDGAGHAIIYRAVDTGPCVLFESIADGSSVANLRLHNLRLASKAVGASISHCLTNVELVKGDITNCAVSNCQSGSFLLLGNVVGCVVSDCAAVLDVDWDSNVFGWGAGGIAARLEKGSVVERCYVTGKAHFPSSGTAPIIGIGAKEESCTIRKCAIGRLELKTMASMFGGSFDFSGTFKRITSGSDEELSFNIALDGLTGYDDPNGMDGKTLDKALFKQSYFENSLHWDFATTWRWDATEDQPVLRLFEGGATARLDGGGDAGEGRDALSQQVIANIWL